jgi:hypothetical protein
MNRSIDAAAVVGRGSRTLLFESKMETVERADGESKEGVLVTSKGE